MKDLKSLFESSLLNEETKTVLKEAWEAALEASRTEIEADYAEKLNEAKKEINTLAIQMVEETVAEELEAIAEELADARSLEVQYASKLQTFKESYAEKTQELVEQLVEETVKTEMTEIKEDIEFAKKHQFGVEMFETFRDVYSGMFGELDSNVHQELEEAKKELDGFRREKIINGLLESVSGEKREVVATILEGVSTDRLEAKFETLRPVILKETKAEEPAEPAITEGKEVEGTVVIESAEGGSDRQSSVDDAAIEKIRRSLRLIK